MRSETSHNLRRRRPRPAAWVLAAALGLASATPQATDLATRDEALRSVYPNAQFKSERVFLTAAQLERARAESGQEIASPLIARYLVRRDGRPAGRAYVDTHVVRTKKESLLICLDQAGLVKRIEVTAFLEPPEYRASAPFYAQYAGRTLSQDLQLNRAIRPIAGATLTVRSANEAVRRVLAIDRVLASPGAGGGTP